MPLGNPMGYFTGAGSMSGMGGFDPMMLQRLQAGMAGMGTPTPGGQNIQNFLQPGGGTLGAAAGNFPTLGAAAQGNGSFGQVPAPFQQMQKNLGAAVQPGAFNMGAASNGGGGWGSLGQAALDQNRNRGGMANPGTPRRQY